MSHWSGSRSLASVTSSILDPHWNFSQLSCVLEILQQLWISRTGPFMCPNNSHMVQILGWANSAPWIWAWGAAELVSSMSVLYLNHQGEISNTAQQGHPVPPSAGGRVISPTLVPSGQLTSTIVVRASSLCCPGE